MSVGVSLVIALGIRLAMGKPKLIPGKTQAMFEVAIEGLKGMFEPIVGKKMVGPTFPFLITLFFFILFQNWAGLLPGVGTFGPIGDHHGEPGLSYIMRPGNTDLTTPLALAIVSFAAWIWYVLRYAGIKHFLFETFGNKANKKSVPSFIYYPMGLIFLLVGCIEVISILIRPVSLSFRLFGNMFGGENLMMNVTGMFQFLIPIPIYFLEFLIGLVQAFVFTLLSAVYIGLVCNAHEEHQH